MDALKLDLQNNCIPKLGEGSQPQQELLSPKRQGSRSCSLFLDRLPGHTALCLRDGVVLLFSSKEWLHSFLLCGTSLYANLIFLVL